MEIISAGHVAKYVEGPFDQRGGMMLVGPPGQLKSTIIKQALIEYPDTLILSDVNVQEMGRLKNSLIGGRYTSIGFGEFEKLYERNPATASNLEGVLRAMIEEGFDKLSFESQQMASMKAQIFLVGGITPSAYAKRYQNWIDSGFARRFIWIHYRLDNPDVLVSAIRAWKKIDFGKISCKIPASRSIPYIATRETNRWLEKMLDHQPAKETPLTVLKKIYCVLVWRYNRKAAKRLLEDFAPSMSRSGANLFL